MRVIAIILVSLIGSSLSSNARYSHRTTRVELLYRKTREFESDARARFAAEGRAKLDQCLGAFTALIGDLAVSSRITVRQIERLTESIERQYFVDSLRVTLVKSVIALDEITNIDLMAYPGMFEADEQLIVARLLRVAARIGLPISRVQKLADELEFNIPDLDERLHHVESLLESHSENSSPDVHNISILALLGLPARPGWIKDFSDYHFDFSLNHFIPHSLTAQLATLWDTTKQQLLNLRNNQERARGLVVIEEMWEVFNSAHEALKNVPLGFRNLDAEITVFVSAMSDLTLLMTSDPRQSVADQEAINQGIINKLRPIIPILEGYAREALSEVSETRSRLMDKIDGLLLPEARILIKPLLEMFVQMTLRNLLDRSTDGQLKYSEEVRTRWISFLEIQLDAYIEAFRTGEGYMSLSDHIGCQLYPLEIRTWASRFSLGDILSTTFGFSRRLGIAILGKGHSHGWATSERMKNFRLVMAACVQLGFLSIRSDELADSTDFQLNEIVMVLSGMVARRNFFLSLNEDNPTAIGPALGMLERLLRGDGYSEYTEWVSENLIIIPELLPLLRKRGFLLENIRNIMSYFGYPDRFVTIFKKIEYLANRSSRIGSMGNDLFYRLKNSIGFPERFLKIEIQLGLLFLHGEDDPAKVAFRNILEAVFRDYIEFLEIAARKYVGEPDNTGCTMRVLDDISRSLPDASSGWNVEDFESFGVALAELSADIKREKESLLP